MQVLSYEGGLGRSLVGFGLPMPNFNKVFGLWKELKFFLRRTENSVFGLQLLMPKKWRPSPTRYLVPCLEASTTCCCRSLLAHGGIEYFPFLESKPRSVLPKL